MKTNDEKLDLNLNPNTKHKNQDKNTKQNDEMCKQKCNKFLL
jgi:hypothetical protein